MRYITKEITPADAQKMLDSRAANRGLSLAQVERFARDMRAGLWRITGVPVIFNDQGQLIDGQHRIAAIVAANVAITLTLCLGVSDPEAQKSIDTGRIRSTVHVLSMFYGVKSAARVAGVAKMLVMLGRDASGHLVMSPDDVVGVISARPGAQWVMDKAEAKSSSRKSVSPILAAFAIAYEKDERLTSLAFDAFYNNEFTGKNDPMNALSRWLDNPASVRNGRTDRLALARRTLSALAARFQGLTMFKSYDSAEGMKFFNVTEAPKARRKRAA